MIAGIGATVRGNLGRRRVVARRMMRPSTTRGQHDPGLRLEIWPHVPTTGQKGGKSRVGTIKLHSTIR